VVLLGVEKDTRFADLGGDGAVACGIEPLLEGSPARLDQRTLALAVGTEGGEVSVWGCRGPSSAA
jgi:hypothetical protein